MADELVDRSSVVDRRLALVREWNQLVNKVRGIAGFEDFAALPRPETLLRATFGGPVVVLNVSRYRCDALIVETSGIRVCPFPELTEDAVTVKAIDYLRALRKVDEAVLALYAARESIDNGEEQPASIVAYTLAKKELVAAARERDATLQHVAEWLWEEIAHPVLDLLRFIGPEASGGEWPRLWWCPTGALAFLPLHAAGHHESAGEAQFQTVVDRAISSYTPSLRALLDAQRPIGATMPERLLVISVPDVGDMLPLASVERERDLLVRRFPRGHTLLADAAASWEAVSADLPQHRWAHFICHGTQYLASPSHGGLRLHDRLLTVADISAARYDGEFAFLSACMTATGSVDIPDETVTLAAALHHAGYRHVIATMWSVYDDTAADVAEAVYADLTATGTFEPRRAATALHRAIRTLRDKRGTPLHAWAPFTHTGP